MRRNPQEGRENRKQKEKTSLTLTGLLMEGVAPNVQTSCLGFPGHPALAEWKLALLRDGSRHRCETRLHPLVFRD
jgi:hypothetical protein